jgi:hypothetical protein
MGLPEYITHYFEADRGPFRNICDLSDEEAGKLVREEEDARTGFNRFAMGPDFLAWRREADDLLIRAYSQKFGHPPEGRPYFALLGSFDKTLTMFREGKKIEMEVSGFSEKELTFMYPDHAHLVTVYGPLLLRSFTSRLQIGVVRVSGGGSSRSRNCGRSIQGWGSTR